MPLLRKLDRAFYAHKQYKSKTENDDNNIPIRYN